MNKSFLKMNTKPNMKKSRKFVPQLKLSTTPYIDSQPCISIANTLFSAYSSDNKKILWTSQDIAKNLIEKSSDKMFVLNLVTEKYYTCSKPNIYYYHIPIVDDICSGEIIAENFPDILKVFKEWYESPDVNDLIVHCRMGIHRSFTVATILSMFLHHKKNSPREYIPKSKDYNDYIDIIQMNNGYTFEPAGFADHHLCNMYTMFIETC